MLLTTSSTIGQPLLRQSTPVEHWVNTPWTELHAGIVVVKGLGEAALPAACVAAVAQGAAHHVRHPWGGAVAIAINQLCEEGLLLLCESTYNAILQHS